VAETSSISLDPIDSVISSRYCRGKQFIEMLVVHQPDFAGVEVIEFGQGFEQNGIDLLHQFIKHILWVGRKPAVLFGRVRERRFAFCRSVSALRLIFEVIPQPVLHEQRFVAGVARRFPGAVS
jgi:hypothetical protein